MADSSAPLKRQHPNDDAGNAAKKAKPDVAKIMAEARAKLAARAAALKAPPTRSSSPSATPLPASSSVSPSPGPPLSAAQQRLAEMKQRLSSSLSRSATPAASTSGRPTAAASIPIRPPPREELEMPEEQLRARGGLDVGLHPALLADSDSNSLHKKQAIQPKYATTLANRRTETQPIRGPKHPSPDFSDPAKNPYYDPSLGTGVRGRASKALVFNQKGKYIEQANALRRQAALEAMKKRIAETARKVGIDEDMETDKAFLREAPPEIEWWDQGLTTNSTYDDIANDQLRINSEDSIITIYIQHPIQLEPPQEKHIPPPKPLPLTAKEQAKKRRQKRMEDLKEKQAKQRLGLEPAPPPKMTRANMMRVMGEEAVKNPTAVEARVDREIADRFSNHLQMNEERKLTKEQKEEKLMQNREKDLAKGIHCVVFRIENLCNGRHMFKINKFAEQYSINGICILNPKFNLVVAEGGEWSITKYKKLFLQRIDWTDNGDGDASGGTKSELDKKQDLSQNKCTMIWEGEVKTQGFRKFTTKPCPTDALAKEALGRAKMENFWTVAKNWIKAL
ncbi:PRP3-domain-containing protein [Terfezia boudieri ATCC MYA-4762]|uniref:PRP3-domain-containing protein n=1 Tax=Terfezia boudieri ATCC MYA-4762 TaxID=1051890 RepID=A0A3N4M3M9_9PEZI|nr:PRP3-domain-containing protein [Terfezia boudieri ATCC MYA-4762]